MGLSPRFTGTYGRCARINIQTEIVNVVQALYDFSRNKLQQKVSQRFLVNRGVPYDVLKV